MSFCESSGQREKSLQTATDMICGKAESNTIAHTAATRPRKHGDEQDTALQLSNVSMHGKVDTVL